MSSKKDQMRALAESNVGEVKQVADAPLPIHAGSAPDAPAAKGGKHDGVVRSKDVAKIPVSRIIADPGQPREEFDPEALARLAASMRTKGQLQPIRVRWDQAAGYYVVVVGERRWRAASDAGLETLTCVIQEDMSESDLRAIQLIENSVREELNPIDRAKAMQSLIRSHGYTQQRLSTELGLSQATVAQALAGLDLQPEVQEMVARGEIGAKVGYQLSQVKDPAEQVAIAKEAVADDLSRDEVAAKVKASKARSGAKGGKGKAPAKPKFKPTWMTRLDGGPKVTVEWKKGVDPTEVPSMLRQAASIADTKLAG